MIQLRIKEVAEAQGLNITTFSRRAELSYPHASSIWHGRIRNLELETLFKIAERLRVPVATLLVEPDLQM